MWSPVSSIIAKHSLAWPLWFSLWKGAKVMLEIEEAEDLVWTRNKIRPPAVLPKDTHQHLFAIPICSKLHPSQTASCGDMSLNLEIICCVPYLICTIIDHSSICLYYVFMFSFFLVSPGSLGRRSHNLNAMYLLDIWQNLWVRRPTPNNHVAIDSWSSNFTSVFL